MDDATRERLTVPRRDALMASAGLTPGHYREIGGFENILYAGERDVIRFTHRSHRDAAALRGEFEFVSYLADNDCRVCRPLPLQGGNLMVKDDEFMLARFELAPGRAVAEEDWNASLFRRWGESIGRFHRLAANFRPVEKRMHWDEDPNHDFDTRIPVRHERIRELAQGLLADLHLMDRHPSDYGLIHGDAHAGNFFVHDGMPTFFDFDDTINTWYVYDIATLVFSVALHPSTPPGRAAASRVVREFLGEFLEGYSREATYTDFMRREMSRFVKLRELSLFAVIHAFMDVDNIEGEFPRRFMEGRVESLERGLPFVDVDYAMA